MINTGKFAGKTVFITGATRGIGKAIALKIAKDGANIVIAAKTTESHAKLEGTIYTAAKEVEAVGGKCLPVKVDLREESQLVNAIDETIKQFGGIDILVNNASAISLSGTEETQMKRYDLMHQINTRGTFLASKYAIPHLKKASNPHILNLSPPLVMSPKWFKDNVAYTMAKYGMSMCVLGMSEELRQYGIAVNALWPKTAIWTAAMNLLGGDSLKNNCRKDTIISDAAYVILSKDSKSFTGNFCIDEHILRNEGITDFQQYAVSPGNPLVPDFFLPDSVLNEFDPTSLNTNFNPTNKQPRSQSANSANSVSSIAQIFDSLRTAINDDVKKEINAVLSFVISGENWLIESIDSRPLRVESTEATNPDITLITDNETFIKMVKGEVKSTDAFISGKLKIKGNITIAMKIQKLFGELKSKY